MGPVPRERVSGEGERPMSDSISCQQRSTGGAAAGPAAGPAALSRVPDQGMATKEISPTIWGLATSFDLYECDPATIRDANKIRQFVVELCDLIEMKRFGETQVVHFGEDARVAGFSMVQLIETSLISAHFANLTNAVYLDVFSCKLYDPQKVEDFAMEFFGASRCLRHTAERL